MGFSLIDLSGSELTVPNQSTLCSVLFKCVGASGKPVTITDKYVSHWTLSFMNIVLVELPFGYFIANYFSTRDLNKKTISGTIECNPRRCQSKGLPWAERPSTYESKRHWLPFARWTCPCNRGAILRTPINLAYAQSACNSSSVHVRVFAKGTVTTKFTT